MRTDEEGARLVDRLALWLPEALGRPVARARVRAMIAAGAVRVDGVPARGAGIRLRAGQRVVALVRADRLIGAGPSRDRGFVLTAAAVLYRDDVLLVVDKPAGLPTHATADPSRPHLVAHVERFLAGQGGAPYVAVHQRLDRDTSGIVLFATDPRANEALAAAFQGRAVEKTYLALTARPRILPPRRFRVDRRIDVEGGEAGRVRVGGRGGQEAATEIEIREILPRALLVEARPLTGRKHQIRAHFADAGLPILGDEVYGRPPRTRGATVPRLMLHACRLALLHPLTRTPLLVESPLPADFRATLALLREAR